jgi:hypothetical protein
MKNLLLLIKVLHFLVELVSRMIFISSIFYLFLILDLCYGRWDNHLHKLTDLGSVLPIKTIITTTTNTSTTCAISGPSLNNETHSIILEETNINVQEVESEINNRIRISENEDVDDKNDKKRQTFLRMISLPSKTFENKTDNKNFNDNMFINNNVYGDLNTVSLESDAKTITDNNNKKKSFKLSRSKSLELNDNILKNDDDSIYKGLILFFIKLKKKNLNGIKQKKKKNFFL